MTRRTDIIVSAIFITAMAVALYVFSGYGPVGKRQNIEIAEGEARYKAEQERAAQNVMSFNKARRNLISMRLDDTVKNYYLQRLDEQSKGMFGGADSIMDTLNEASTRQYK